MKKFIMLLSTVLSLSLHTSAQTDSFVYTCHRDTAYLSYSATAKTTTSSCPPASSAFLGIYKQNTSYMPDNSSTNPLATKKTIKLVLNIINPAVDGPPYVNYHSSDETFIRGVFDQVNYYLSHNAAPTDPVVIGGRSTTVTDTRFRVEIAQIRYLNADLYLFSEYTYMYEPEKYLNVFITYNPDAPSVRALWTGAGVPTQMYPAYDDLLAGEHDKVSYINLKGLYQSATDWRTSTNKIAQLFLHQLGHCMGLRHTYEKENGSARQYDEEYNNESFYDYLADVFNYSASGSKYYPRPDDATDCKTFAAANANHNDKLINNVMSGNLEGLSFTHIQLGRMHRNAHFLSIRKNVYVEDPEDAAYSGTHEGQLHPLNITSNQTWDFDIKMYTDIVVKAGNTLTITCKVSMPFHSQIYVEQGAKIIIDGGTITSDRSNTKWRGIFAYGTASMPQDAAYQGIVELKNGATIENALNGVTVDGGAILRCSGSHFLNNRKGIQFWKFANKATTTSTTEISNISYIQNTDFIVDDNYYADGTTSYKIQQGISFWEVKGINVMGCRFENQMSDTKKTIYGSGTGILTDRADITVNSLCTSSGGGSTGYPCSSTIPSWFKGFKFGICVANVEKAAKTVRVANTSFEHNLYGVYDKATNLIDINRSTFDLYDYSDEGSSPLYGLGIYIDGATGYNIEGNSFNGHGYRTADVGKTYPYYYAFTNVGTYCNATGSDNNRIYRNYFNLLIYGAAARGVNRGATPSSSSESDYTGLQFECNNFGINVADILNDAEGADDGIRLFQGYGIKAAGNTFSINPPVANPSFLKNFVGSTSAVPVNKYYWYHYNPVEQPIRYLSITSVMGIPYQNPCYSSYSGGLGTSPFIGRELSTTLFSDLMDAIEDTTTTRNDTLHSLFTRMYSPYGNLENTLLYLEEGNETAAMNSYNNITQSYPMTVTESHEFDLGRTLINMIAQHYRDSISFDSLTTVDQDSLRYIIASGSMWAKVRACNWLSRVTGEECDESLPPIPVDTTIDSNSIAPTRLGLGNGSNFIDINPNPSSGKFVLTYNLNNTSQQARLAIMDVSGKLVLEKVLSASVSSMGVDATQWPSGVYMYRVVQGSKTIGYGKMVKQ